MSKVLCPYHDDKTPSLHLYEEFYHCFVCLAHGPLEKLKEKGILTETRSKEKYVENLQEMAEYISSLPQAEIRGLVFPQDVLGYYIRWPNDLYYKCRLWKPKEDRGKYQNPAGHPQPLFWARRNTFKTLILIEGEINALSLASTQVPADIASPGSAGNFNEKHQYKYLTHYIHYGNIVIIVDNDAPGLLAAIELKALLLKKVPYIDIVLMDQDCNEILVQHGKEELQKRIERQLQKVL